MDFSKAFDKIDLQRLLLKLHRIGINSSVVKWISAFLSNRSQFIVLGGEESDSCSIQTGVPPRLCSSPVFFIYINDMPDTIHSNIRLLADDTIMYLTVSNQSDCQALQTDSTYLEKWENEWLMSFNPDKCEVLRITKKEKTYYI